MTVAIPFDRLGRFGNDWLDSRFHFNFSGVAAPMGFGFGPLRVWNDDHIKPHSGFPMHGHRDMEIITYVRRGAITHEDSLGNRGRTPAGDVQVMSAGTGIMHAEWNEENEATHLFQIWVEPRQRGLKPRWAQAQFPKDDRAGKLVPLASGEEAVRAANPETLLIHQDATLYGALLGKGDSVTHTLPWDDKAQRIAYVVVADGTAIVNGNKLSTRDGMAVFEAKSVEITAPEGAEVLLFDLPVPPQKQN
ncbi:pirin family protein [Ferrovibrio sp. MS7]|uniref:pirin family protein n=1 Tax=Ferrovibrio plantarum TaxID=3119164 RepID=UPI001B5E9A61|nr:pirin family protein [Ferrovibrio sp.]